MRSMSEDDPSTEVGVRRRMEDRSRHINVPALTIVWHRDVSRVGDCGPLLGEGDHEIGRKTRPFDPVRDRMLPRAGFLKVVDHGGALELMPLLDRIPIEIDGRFALIGPRRFEQHDVKGGVILVLADEMVVCLHRRESPSERGPALGMIGNSDRVEQVRRQICRVADLNSNVLIRGETGSGKELVAKAIQSGSKRAGGPFVSVSMADVPPQTAASALFGHERGAFTGAAQAHAGHFVQADGGTLFLDEIALAPVDVQNMLLRVLETGEIRPVGGNRTRRVDVRVIAATDARLDVAMVQGRFSEPLFHRLTEYQLHIPSLRERREDIGPLFLHFLREKLTQTGEQDRLASREFPEPTWLDPFDVAKIAANPFPGNVRQLRNVASQLVTTNRGESHARVDGTVQHLLDGEDRGEATHDRGAARRPTKVSDEQIDEALRRHNYNIAAAAQELGIQRGTLYDRIRQGPDSARKATEIAEDELVAAFERHAGDVAAMAGELRVSPKALAARLRKVPPGRLRR
jgi:two-component system nitrogen regulation response regulator GlnG